MKKFLLILVNILPLFLAAQPCKEVVGYYAGWQWYDRNKLMNPQSVPYSKYSILTYAFFLPQTDGSFKISDPWSDKNQLLGPINWTTAPAGYDNAYDFGNPAYHLPNQKLSDYSHQGGCKLLVSIGGWTYSANFPAIAANAAKRAVFANNCNTIVKLYNLDGIDIDWEYPANITEKQNFTILLQQVRDSLNAIEPLMNRPLLLTIAAGASPANIANVDWTNVKNIVNIVNMMSYDFYGTWDNFSSHNSPLYPTASFSQPGFSCTEAVANLLAAGVPANKITMGVAWYGRSHMTVGTPNVYVAGTGQADMTQFSLDDGIPLYYNIMAKMSNFNSHWDSVAKVPYLTGKTTNSFVSYDNDSSIGLKAQYIKNMNLRGAIIWEISGDYIESSPIPGTIVATPLTDKLNAVFCSSSTDIAYTEKSEPHISIYPNPVNDKLLIVLNDFSDETVIFQISNTYGQILFRGIGDGKDPLTADVSNLESGMYFLLIKTHTHKLARKIIIK